MAGNANSGRRRRPTALKLYRGDREGFNHRAPVPPADPVVCPERLSPAAQAVWARLAPVLNAMKILTVADVQAFGALCELIATADAISQEKASPDFKPLVMKIIVDPDGNTHLEAREHPILRMERQTAGALRPYFAQFGMEPSARARLIAPAAGQVDEKWAGQIG